MGDIESKIISIKEALHKASQMNLDVVEISPNAEPPVCKLIDYKKFIYDQKKKQKLRRENHIICKNPTHRNYSVTVE